MDLASLLKGNSITQLPAVIVFVFGDTLSPGTGRLGGLRLGGHDELVSDIY
jgi:hypothetical protein